MKRLEVNVITGETTEVELTSAEQAQAQAQYTAWQIEKNIWLDELAKEEAKQIKFQEWLKTQG